MHDTPDDLLEHLRSRALPDAAAAARDLGAEELDLVQLARGDEARGPARDLTLGGYMSEHDRPPAFEGADGEPYSVDIEVVPRDGPVPGYVAFLVFLRWAHTGAGIMDHVESDDVAQGDSGEAARAGALALSLHEVKDHLDAAIARRRAELDE